MPDEKIPWMEGRSVVLKDNFPDLEQNYASLDLITLPV